MGDVGEIWRLSEEGAPRLEGLAEQLQQRLAQRRVSPAQQRQHRGREIARRPQLQHTRRVGEGCGQQARLTSALTTAADAAAAAMHAAADEGGRHRRCAGAGGGVEGALASGRVARGELVPGEGAQHGVEAQVLLQQRGVAQHRAQQRGAARRRAAAHQMRAAAAAAAAVAAAAAGRLGEGVRHGRCEAGCEGVDGGEEGLQLRGPVELARAQQPEQQPQQRRQC